LLEAYRVDLCEYIDTQYRTHLSSDLFIGVLFELVELSIAFASELSN